MNRRRRAQEEIARLTAELPDEAAVVALVEAFEPLVHTLAVRYWQPILGNEIEDLEQVARIGVLKACRSFDPKRGVFAAHFVWGIRHELSDYVRNQGSPVRLPQRLMRQLGQLQRLRQQRVDNTIAEHAQTLGLPEASVVSMLCHLDGPVELDALALLPSGNRSVEWTKRDRALLYKVPLDMSAEDAALLREEINARGGEG